MFVIFDLDGTLYDTSSSLCPSIFRTCSEFDLQEPTREEILKEVHGSASTFYRRLFPSLSSEEADRFSKKAFSYELEEIKKSGALYEGVKELLFSLQKEHQLAICSNGGKLYIETILTHFDLDNFFLDVSPSDGGDAKVQRLKALCDKYSFDAVMVGDRDGDFIAAREVGIPSIGVSYGFGSEEELAKASRVVARVKEIEGEINLYFSV